MNLDLAVALIALILALESFSTVRALARIEARLKKRGGHPRATAEQLDEIAAEHLTRANELRREARPLTIDYGPDER